VVEIRLMLKYIREGLPDVVEPKLPSESDSDAPMSFAY